MIVNPEFSQQDHQTWRQLFQNQSPLRCEQIIPEFTEGLNYLGITQDHIPDLAAVNSKLQKKTGWEGVFVKGFESPLTFYEMLAHKKFPIGSFIRDAKDLSYTPEPDIFHDLYGHIPFYTIPEYASFCQDFGQRGLKYLNSEKITEEFQRLFWFTIEFGLLKTTKELKVFGAGIASSFGECAYALSNKPVKKAFNLEDIRNKPFRIDLMQDQLFVIEDIHQLYKCLDDFEKKYKEKT